MLLPEYMLYLNNKPMKTKTKTQPKKKPKHKKTLLCSLVGSLCVKENLSSDKC